MLVRLGLLVILLLMVASPVAAQHQSQVGTPWWATTLAVAGPLADGASTVYAMRQPGVVEGNPVFYHLFGSDVTSGEIMAFKVGQAVLVGTVVHYAGKRNRKAAIGVAVATFAINAVAVGINLRAARSAQLSGRVSR